VKLKCLFVETSYSIINSAKAPKRQNRTKPTSTKMIVWYKKDILSKNQLKKLRQVSDFSQFHFVLVYLRLWILALCSNFASRGDCN
jgi:hypothetical protein